MKCIWVCYGYRLSKHLQLWFTKIMSRVHFHPKNHNNIMDILECTAKSFNRRSIMMHIMRCNKDRGRDIHGDNGHGGDDDAKPLPNPPAISLLSEQASVSAGIADGSVFGLRSVDLVCEINRMYSTRGYLASWWHSKKNTIFGLINL